MFNRCHPPRLKRSSSSHKCNGRCKSVKRESRLSFETLEDKRMFALLGVAPLADLPFVDYNVSGSVNYNAATDLFSHNAIPISFDDVSESGFFDITSSSLSVNILVDNTGFLPVIGYAGTDFVLTGDLDTDGDLIPDYSGVLLTGEVTGFGHFDSGSSTDTYDFRFAVTGGLLASRFDGKDIGMITTSEGSSFAGSFDESFSGLVKGALFGIPKQVTGEFASLGGEKYLDDDGQLPTAGSTPVEGVVIDLYEDNGANAGVYDAGDTFVATTETAVDGSYLFSGLFPGNYIVKEVVPAGSTSIGVSEYAVTLAAGDHFADDYDFYNYIERGSLGGVKTYEYLDCKCDKYGNPITSTVTAPLAGVTVNLFLDANDNGQLDPGEGDVEDILATDVTDVSGAYFFDDLLPGAYIVQEVLQSGYVALTPAIVAVDVVAGTNAPVNFKNKLVKGSIGNYFFIDYNSNSIQDIGDMGVNGITVKLLDKYGSTIATTVTASDGGGNAGYYLFYNLDAGDYFVEFVVPTGVTFVTKNVGVDDSLDSDVNSNGRTDKITLAANTHIRTVDAGVKDEVCIENVVYKVKDYFDKCQQSKAGTIKGVTLEYNDGTDELFVQVTVASYNGKIANGFTIVLDDGTSIGDKAGTHAVFYFDASGATPVLNVLAYNGDQNGSSIRDSNGNTSSYDPDRVATSLDNSSGWLKEISATGNSSKKVFTFKVDVGAINDHVPLRNINWQGSEIGKYASFLVDTYSGLQTKYDASGFLTKWTYACHGWMDACQIKTQKCTVKECIAIDEMFAEWGWTTSAFTGNSDGDPLADIGWAGSEAAACDCDDDPCKPRKDCDDRYDGKDDCFKDFGRKLYSRC
jgi:hypothetical protein